MKSLLLITLSLALTACQPGKSSRANPLALGGARVQEGGVDVGNMNSALVPRTNASMSYPTSWTSRAMDAVLTIEDATGSMIKARRAGIKEIASPTAVALQQYLKSKFPERTYNLVEINGLKGVRAELKVQEGETHSDLYLLSESGDFIQIESRLKGTGVTEGEKIILSVRVKYAGVPYPNAKVNSVSLQARGAGVENRHAYSFLADCFTYEYDKCSNSGVAVSSEQEFHVGTAGYDHGRVVELGPESEIPFDSIRIEGEFLVAPVSNTPISDIYTAFTPKTLTADQDRIALKAGHTYLVRTIRWPEEDLITKMKVDELAPGGITRITYQKLVYVKKEQLQKQVDAINAYTREFEAPLETGEVTLYDRAQFGNYYFASFNFTHSTSGNMFITRNSWDVMFERDEISVPRTGSGIGSVIDVGDIDIATVNLKMYPNPNGNTDKGQKLVVGHTYLIYQFHYDDPGKNATYGALKLLAKDPNGKWARFQFRRIAIKDVGHFQEWVGLNVPTEPVTVTLEMGGQTEKSRFYPFIMKRGDQGGNYYEMMEFFCGRENASCLRVDSRPYGKERGFFKLPAHTNLSRIALKDVLTLRGQLKNDVEIRRGNKYAVLLENFYNLSVMVMSVDELAPGKSVTLTFRYLQRAKTPYSDDKE